jgi:zinc finger HIT domain-containing protein 1
MSKRAPKFQEALDSSKGPAKKKRYRTTDYYKKYGQTFKHELPFLLFLFGCLTYSLFHCNSNRYRKSIPQLIEEDLQKREDGQCPYTLAQVPPSKYPKRHFCNVCGFPSNYTCVKCGVRFCSIKCNTTHQETRCLKWTA